MGSRLVVFAEKVGELLKGGVGNAVGRGYKARPDSLRSCSVLSTYAPGGIMWLIHEILSIIVFVSGILTAIALFAWIYLPQQAISSELDRTVAFIDAIDNAGKPRTITYFVNVGLLKLIRNYWLCFRISATILITSLLILSIMSR